MSPKRAVKKLSVRLGPHWWLWAVTGLWYPDKDIIKKKKLTARRLARMKYEDMLGGGKASYHMLEVCSKCIGVRRLGEDLRLPKPKRGGPLVDVLSRYPNVLYLTRLHHNKTGGRTITIYRAPRGYETVSEMCAALQKRS